MSTEKSNDLVGNRTRDILACSKLPPPTTLPRAPLLIDKNIKYVDFKNENIKFYMYMNMKLIEEAQ
jgi:hypothetical protein